MITRDFSENRAYMNQMKKELQQIESGIDFYAVNPCAFQLLK